ncbi:MAG: hypothetical protein A3G32_06620 [Deltaproteobacteria bacterium RIFCSPLOWO2_12_FULL_40_28]|nr:MAG: hypothetical protein A3C45_02715 [Deltaproteobacteria bacterium RIFCSPHIGHO2_02_FULL_40_28]OGQ19120.1 MAG: hypothetical protein A3E27_05805 [Deltaproteobacteria bacterium RIFCSPHIGHO2_12_FULL_40_32]OGQ40292.1 MAG: hypothetical protein A3I69_01245 [Deltaproteobacteria bacterium RIFCSPLOWO2_02_FULL_40_36]OGQ53563.1 MAG: hypothetical protein A3G32_06620 [Deltaproteobacteria bacterium RIFCSPLOWO2_12_FULL_40_28]
MNLEKLGLLFLLNYFNQWGEVKNHLVNAAAEVLRAARSSVDIISQSPQTLLGQKVELFAPFVSQVQSVLDFGINKMSPSGSSPSMLEKEGDHKLKQHIVDSIIKAIDEEIIGTKEIINDKNRLKVEALYTVKEVLQNQLQKPIAKTSNKKTFQANVA